MALFIYIYNSTHIWLIHLMLGLWAVSKIIPPLSVKIANQDYLSPGIEKLALWSSPVTK
jgi:hypothetical protein